MPEFIYRYYIIYILSSNPNHKFQLVILFILGRNGRDVENIFIFINSFANVVDNVFNYLDHYVDGYIRYHFETEYNNE